jgi:hypothetical protein
MRATRPAHTVIPDLSTRNIIEQRKQFIKLIM